MSYTPINWQTGDTITAAKLNRCDNGWSVENTSTTYFNGSATTVADVPEEGCYGCTLDNVSGDLSSASEVTVTLDNTVYNLIGFDDGGYWTFGAPYQDYSTYSFSIYYDNGSVYFLTETAGTYALKVESDATTIETSSAFASAVGSVVDMSTVPMLCVSDVTTHAEMSAASLSGRILYFRPYDDGTETYYITNFNQSSVDFLPTSQVLSAGFTDGVFTISAS